MSDSTPERNPIDRLAEHFAERLRRGERPALSEYVQQYPELADEIREVFPTLVLMEQLKPNAADDASSKDRRPERIGDYRLLREIGRGGMGVVYEAEQLSLGRHVALKVFPSDGLANPTYLERFRREAKAAARLHHTNIVPVFGVGEGDGVHYYAMQFIHGEGLDKVLHDLRRLRVTPGVRVNGEGTGDAVASRSVAQSLLSGLIECAASEAPVGVSVVEVAPPSSGTLSGTESEAEYCRSVARVGLQVAEALAYAHKQGILHRDIKPSNLLLDLQGTVWITDFGLAKADDADELTHTGDIIGTIRYMAPERFEGASLPQSDVYALGMTLYEMLTLRPAFGENNRARLIQRILHEEPVVPRSVDPRIPRDLETVVLKSIAHDPGRRYATAGELAEDLRRFLADRPVRARRSRPPERLWRWCRRNPAIASLIGVIALLLVVVAVGSSLSAWSLHVAEKDARQKLWRSKLNEARAGVRSRLPGQRFASLQRIREALAIAEQLGFTEEDRLHLRNAAIAALALADCEIVEAEDGTNVADLDFRPAYYARREKDGRMSVRRIRDDWEIAALPDPKRLVSWCLSPDGRHLAVCPNADWENGRMQLWRLDAPKPCCVHEGISLSGSQADFTPDGANLVYASASCLTVVNVATSEARSWPLPGIPAAGGVKCRPGGRDSVVARSVNGKGILQVWELATGVLRTTLEDKGPCSSLDWHPDGRLLAVACDHPLGVISLWDAKAGRPVLTFEGHKTGGVAVRFNRGGDRLFSSDWGGRLRLWDVGSGRQIQGLLEGIVLPLAFGPDDKYVACTDSVEGQSKIRFVRFAAGREVRTLTRVSASGTGRYQGPTFSKDGRLLAVSLADTQLQGLAILDWPSGRELGQLPVGDQAPLGFDSEGALWTGRASGTVFRWPQITDPGTRRLQLGPPQWVVSVPGAEASSLSSDGRLLVLSNHSQGALILHGGPSGKLRPTGRQSDVRYTAVSPDGRWVASGSHWGDRGSSARVWEAQTGRLVHAFDVPSQCSVGFSPDGRWFITANQIVQLWHTGNWTEGPRVRIKSDSRGWTFSPDGQLLALGGHGRVRLVRPESGVEVARLTLAEQTIYDPLCFGPGGELLAQGEDTQAIHVWDLQAIRRQLAELDLDWSDTPGAKHGPSFTPDAPPTAVAFLGADLTTDPLKMRQYQLSQATRTLCSNPLNAVAQRRVGQLVEDTNPAEAFARYSLSLFLEPDQPFVREQRAAAAFRLKRWTEVIADTSRILEQYSDRRWALQYRASAYQQLGRHAEAAADLTALIALTPDASQLYERRAASYAVLGELALAEADRRKARELAPEDSRTLNERAWRLLTGPLAERDAATAMRYVQKAVQLAPEEAAYLNTLGVAQYRNGLYSDAVVTLQKSLERGTGRWDAYDLFFLAMCHQKLGDPATARDCFDRAQRWIRTQKNLPLRTIAELKACHAEAQTSLETQANR